VGGRLADWHLFKTMASIFLCAAMVLAALTLTARALIPAEITLFVWAMLVFAGVPALQINVVNFGRAAPNLISTLNIAAFNGGNALGAWVGGEVISHHLGLDAIPPTAAALSVAALLLTALSRLQQTKRTFADANAV
jgi:DHA1 family inner membrane transport protein